MKSIAWLHDDSLRHWYGDLPAIYIFDEEKLEHEQWTMKRIGFLYECLLELPVEIRRGDPVTEVLDFQKKNHADSIKALQTPDPRLQKQLKALGAEVIAQDEFVRLPAKTNLRRFSTYWKQAAANLKS